MTPRALYAVALVASFVAALLLTPLTARLANRLGILDHPGPNKSHTTATPYLGGLAVALALAAGLFSGAAGELLAILLAGLGLSFVGLMDDQKLVRWWVKLGAEILAGYALWLAGVRGGLFGVEVLDLALTILWVVAVTNAVNMLDNMDGLAPGVAAISALTFFAIAAQRGDFLVGAFSLAVAGASFGFLVWNFPPARVFLGDSGTLLLGFMLAALGLKLDLVGETGFIRSAVPILALGVPLLDMAFVVIDRARGGRRIYQGGTDHSSHRLAAFGLSAAAVALLTYGVQILCSVGAVAVLFAAWPVALTIVLVAGIAAIVVVAFLLRLPTGLTHTQKVRLTPADVSSSR